MRIKGIFPAIMIIIASFCPLKRGASQEIPATFTQSFQQLILRLGGGQFPAILPGIDDELAGNCIQQTVLNGVIFPTIFLDQGYYYNVGGFFEEELASKDGEGSTHISDGETQRSLVDVPVSTDLVNRLAKQLSLGMEVSVREGHYMSPANIAATQVAVTEKFADIGFRVSKMDGAARNYLFTLWTLAKGAEWIYRKDSIIKTAEENFRVLEATVVMLEEITSRFSMFAVSPGQSEINKNSFPQSGLNTFIASHLGDFTTFHPAKIIELIENLVAHSYRNGLNNTSLERTSEFVKMLLDVKERLGLLTASERKRYAQQPYEYLEEISQRAITSSVHSENENQF